MDFTILPMQKAHIAQVAEIEAASFSDPWPRSVLESELLNPLSLWLCAVCGEEVLGYVGSQSVLGEADMMNIAVKESARRQGIARALVTALICGLKEKNVASLTLEVRASNEAAIALYGAFGFSQVGRRKNYYFHPTEDALILKKEWSL